MKEIDLKVCKELKNFVILFIVFSLFLSCNKITEYKIIGIWHSESSVFGAVIKADTQINKDGTWYEKGKHSSFLLDFDYYVSGTWEVNKNYITFYFKESSSPLIAIGITQTADIVSINANTLILSQDGKNITYKRKK